MRPHQAWPVVGTSRDARVGGRRDSGFLIRNSRKDPYTLPGDQATVLDEGALRHICAKPGRSLYPHFKFSGAFSLKVMLNHTHA